jgi:hypothetical protein
LPSIGVEFDAVEDAASAAAGAGMEHGTILAGLLRMWIRCFRTDCDRVDRTQIALLFRLLPSAPAVEMLIDALVAFRFLEALPVAGYRIKGAKDRILRGKAGRRAGGLASAKNLRRAATQPSNTPAGAGREPEDQPGSSLTHSRLPADQHSAISIQPSAVEDPPRRASRARAASRPPLELVAQAPAEPSAWTTLIAELVAIFAKLKGGAKYEFSGQDAKALKTLLESQGAEAIKAAWTRALQHTGFPSVATIHELARHFNHFTAAAKGPATGVRHQRAEAQNYEGDEPF